jgi:hypothetical protein
MDGRGDAAEKGGGLPEWKKKHHFQWGFRCAHRFEEFQQRFLPSSSLDYEKVSH